MRSGAVDYGRLYEQRIAAYLAIKCALDPEVSDFWMLSNVDYVGAFDDIVLMVQDQAGNKKLYCIQLKHTENENALPVVLLERKATKDNKFGLSKYQDSFKTVDKNIKSNKVDILKGICLDQVYFILWTNGPLNFEHKLECINVENVGGMSFLNTASNSNVYKVKNLPSSATPFDEHFLQQFYLLANQVSAISLEKTIKDKLLSEFEDVDNAAIIAITDYFTKWSMGQGKTMLKITKSDIQTRLLEFLFLPHFVEPVRTNDMTSDKFDLLNETLTSFSITQIHETKLVNTVFSCVKFVLNRLCGGHLNLELSWNTELSPTHWNALKTIDNKLTQTIVNVLRERTMFVPSATIKDLYLAAWQCKLIPLVVDCRISPNLIKTVLAKLENVTKDISFVLLNTSGSLVNGNLKTFININSIEDTILKDNILEKTFISMQGKKEINLQVFRNNNAVLKNVTPDVYITLIEGVVNVGEAIEIENYYIERDLRRPLLKLGVLDENVISKDREYMSNTEGDIFILVEYKKGSLPFKYWRHSAVLSKYLREADCQEDENLYILLTRFPDHDKTVITAAANIHKETKKSVHVLKLHDDCLEWSFSKGTVETLQGYLVQSNLLKDEKPQYNIPEVNILKRSRSDVNIISNNAGMGKTFMLHSLYNKFKPNEWVCYVNLSQHIHKLPTKGTLLFFIKYLLQCIVKTTQKYIQDFCTQIYLHCLQTRTLICLFDGFDEIPTAHTISFLIEAKNYGLRMWITTRPTYSKMLERSMGNLSVEITHFSSEDHVTFLWRYFHSYYDVYHYDDGQIQYIVDVISKCSKSLDKTLVVQPLQTRMFAEIFGDDINQIDEKQSLTLVDLYNKFVDVKLKEYKSYEATTLKRTLSKLALKLFFSEELLENVLDFEDLEEEAITFQESYKKDSLVIGLNEKGEAVFGHRTFAEFLAAYWLAKQIVNRSGQYNISWFSIFESLFYIEMINVRIFFDRILSQKLPLHISVLNNDCENVRVLMENTEILQTLDALGRSALHLAVTYGKYHDLYTSEEVKGLKTVGLHSTVKSGPNQCQLTIITEKQYQISGEIVEMLASKCLNTKDQLFKYNLFDYAMKSCSLNFVDILFNQYDEDTLHFEIGYSFEIFLCCVIRENLHNILSKRKNYNFDSNQQIQNELRDMFKGYNSKLLKIRYNDMYLTEMAAWFGAKETLFDLLGSGYLKLEDGQMVHKACLNGRADVLDLLYNMGADINKIDRSYWSPLFTASVNNRDDIFYHLFRNEGVKPTISKMTPMHYAAQGGHLECVLKLLEYGASVSTEDAFGKIPLIYACQYGYSDIVGAFIKFRQLEIPSATLLSAVNVAAFHGSSDCIREMLEYIGADVNSVDSKGYSALITASKKGFSDVVSVLASSKFCNLNLMVRNENMASLQMWCAKNGHSKLHTKLFLFTRNRKENGGITALHFAVRYGHADCARTLVALGADKHIKDEIINYPPLAWASMYGVEKVLKKLLVKSDKDDLVEMRKEAELSLVWASMIGYKKCVEVLREYIEDPELDSVPVEKNELVEVILSREFALDFSFVRENTNMPLILAAKNGCTGVVKTLLTNKFRNNEDLDESFFWAAKEGHLACVKELILAGADDGKKNFKRVNLLPIVWASMYGRTSVVEYLLSNKTKDYLKNRDVYASVNYAALQGHYDCLKLLLDFGLDVDNMDEDLNGTPLICACTYGMATMKVIDFLMEMNCSINTKNRDGLSALDIAANRKKFDFVKRFINSGAFNDLKVEKGSELYGNLELALKWAMDKADYQLIEKLVNMGITVESKG